jgi:G protein-coupled receptor 125
VRICPIICSQNSHNIALEAHAIKASSFNGMTCTLFQKLMPERIALRDLGPRIDLDGNPDRQLSFKCNITSTLSSLALKVSTQEWP